MSDQYGGAPVPPANVPPQKPKSPPWGIIILIIAICTVFSCVVGGGIMAAIAIPNFKEGYQQGQRNACQRNLLEIEFAKQSWAEDNMVDDYSVEPPINALVGSYLDEMPTCPAGGTYTVGNLTEFPSCSIPGHDFPEE
ncbi:hypothetical protein KQI84_05505 [bacterium]|nr:hypothetical protein [bacterium]